MHITNNQKLPKCLVDLVKADQKPPVENRYSVTQVIGNVRELLLTRRHFDAIDLDVSACANTIFGTAVHNLIEKFDHTGMAEMPLEVQIGQFTLAGRIDLYDKATHTLIDWKTASSWKVAHGDFEDYRRQGLVYAWMMLLKGYVVEKLQFNMFIKDWSSRCEFPQIYTWEYKVTTADLLFIQEFIYKRFEQIEYYEEHLNALPDCEDTWFTGDKYAVYTNKSKADRVCDSEQEAHDYITNRCGGVGRIEVRRGQHKKCQDYCLCRTFCKFWKEREVE